MSSTPSLSTVSVASSPRSPNQQLSPTLLAALPQELRDLIFDHLTLSPDPCLRHIFSLCPNSSACPSGHHCSNRHPPPVTPPQALTCLSRSSHYDVHQLFYTHNLFIFSLSAGGEERLRLRPYPHSIAYKPTSWLLRNASATRLLDFTRRPRWRASTSLFLMYNPYSQDKAFDYIDNYRHLIRHLVLKSQNPLESPPGRPHDFSEWHWPLNVDWKTLPDLETLYLGFRGFGLLVLNGYDEHVELRKSVTGARRMAGMKLKKLVLVGLRSHIYRNVPLHEQRVRRWFQPALGTDGVLELWEEDPQQDQTR